MHYDPIKQQLGKVFNKNPLLRILFYKLLDILLLRSWHIRKEIRNLKSCLPLNPDILDAGSGFGQYAYYLTGKFKSGKVKGIDIKKDQVNDCNNFAKSAGLEQRLSFSQADLTEFREDKKYDLILCVDVMEHIENDILVFRNLEYALKPGGILLISTPSDKGGSDVHHEGDESFIGEHVRNGYGINDIGLKLKQAGFVKVNSRYSYGKPGKMSWKFSMKYPIKLLNFSKLFYFVLPFYYLAALPCCMLLNVMDVNADHDSGTGLIVKAYKQN